MSQVSVQLMAGAVAIETKRLMRKVRFSAGFTTKAVLWFPLRKFAHGGKGDGPPAELMKVAPGRDTEQVRLQQASKPALRLNFLGKTTPKIPDRKRNRAGE